MFFLTALRAYNQFKQHTKTAITQRGGSLFTTAALKTTQVLEGSIYWTGLLTSNKVSCGLVQTTTLST